MPNMVKESDTSAALLARDEILRNPSKQECRSESESSVVNIMKKPVDIDVGTMQFQFKTRLKLNLSIKFFTHIKWIEPSKPTLVGLPDAIH